MHELGELLAEFDPALLQAWGHRTVAHPFDLETGQELLEPWFNKIQVVRYPDRLLVTDPMPLDASVLSMGSLARMLATREDGFHRYVEDRVSESKPFHISKDTGSPTAPSKRW